MSSTTISSKGLVVTIQGQRVGTVAEVLHTAAANCSRCARKHGEVLVPFVSAIVTSVSLADRTSKSIRPRVCWSLSRMRMRIDVVTIFPEVLGPAATVAAGQGH